MKPSHSRLARSFLLVVAVLVTGLVILACGKEQKAKATPGAPTQAAATTPSKATPSGTSQPAAASARLASAEFKELPTKVQEIYPKFHPDTFKRPDPYEPVYGGVWISPGGCNANWEMIGAGLGNDCGQLVTARFFNRLINWGDDLIVEKVEPEVVETWQMSPDGMKFTFKLRDGITWPDAQPANGRKFTVQDAKWWLDTLFFDKKNSAFAAEATEVQSVDIVDDRTLTITTNKPFVSLPNFLAQKRMGIQARECFEDDKCRKGKPYGFGAFQLKDYQEGVKAVFERNQKYVFKEAQSGKPLPYLDGFQRINIGDVEAQVAAFRTGQMDSTQQLVPWERLQVIMKDVPGMRVFMDGPCMALFNCGFTFSFNLAKDGPWKDVRVRQALSLAIDRKKLCDVAMGGICAIGMHIPYYEVGRPVYFSPYQPPTQLRYDPEQAKKLLKDAGFESGFTIKVTTGQPAGSQSDLEMANIQNLVKQMWEAIGVKTEYDILPGGTNSNTVAAIKKEWPALLNTRYLQGGARSDISMWNFLHSKGVANYSSINDPELDKLLDDWKSAVDQRKRMDLAKQVLARTLDQMWAIYTVDGFRLDPYEPWAINLAGGSDRASNSSGMSNFQKAWLDPKKGLPAARQFTPRSKP